MLKALIVLFIFIILLVPVLYFIGCSISGKKKVKGSGDLLTEERVLPEFDELSIANAFKVKLTCGEAQKVVISADDNLLPYIKTEMEGSKLKIYSKETLVPVAGLDITISVQNLRGISCAGAVKLDAGGISAETFTLKVAGACTVNLAGEVVDFNINGAGAAKLDSEDFLAENVKIKMAGACKASIFATKTIDVNVAGAVKVTYSGKPAIVNKSIAGAALFFEKD